MHSRARARTHKHTHMHIVSVSLSHCPHCHSVTLKPVCDAVMNSKSQRCEIRQNTWTHVSNAHYIAFNARIQCRIRRLSHVFWRTLCLISDVFRTSVQDATMILVMVTVDLISAIRWRQPKLGCVPIQAQAHTVTVTAPDARVTCHTHTITAYRL